MHYSAFLKEGDIIGIPAPSAGVGDKIPDFTKSLDILHKEGFQTNETASVRSSELASNDGKTRAIELMSLFEDDTVNMVIAAAGGDFLYEILPYTDFQKMAEHPKWMMGASDPTGILYPYTTLYDIATMYGFNAGSFDLGTDWDYIHHGLQVITGKDLQQKSYPMHMSKAKFLMDVLAYDSADTWKSPYDKFHVTGRCIGGCMDVLKDLMGTPYDGTLSFLERYKEDGAIYYFDNFALSAENFYRTLLQFKYAGWFNYAKGIIIGRVCLPSSDTGMTYEEACAKALGDIPYVMEADVGHTVPYMVMINGALLDLDWHDKQASLQFILK